MHRFLVVCCLLFVAAPVTAAEDELRRLAGSLQQELGNSDLDAETRAEIRALLTRSLELAKAAPGRRPPDPDCMSFATPIYEKQFQASAALEMAAKACADPVDGDVLELAYEVYAKGFQPTSALAEALKLAQKRDLDGKSTLIQLAYPKLAKQYQPASALAEAARLASTAPRGSEACVTKAFETYSKQFQPHDALKSAFATCGGSR